MRSGPGRPSPFESTQMSALLIAGGGGVTQPNGVSLGVRGSMMIDAGSMAWLLLRVAILSAIAFRRSRALVGVAGSSAKATEAAPSRTSARAVTRNTRTEDARVTAGSLQGVMAKGGKERRLVRPRFT